MVKTAPSPIGLTLVGSDQLGQRASQVDYVPVGQLVGEITPDTRLMLRPYRLEARPAAGRYRSVEATAVMAVESPPYQAATFHAVEQAGESASTQRVAEDHRSRQLLEGKLASRGRSQMDEDVEFLDGQALVGEVDAEPPHDESRCPLQIAPGGLPLLSVRCAHDASVDELCAKSHIDNAQILAYSSKVKSSTAQKEDVLCRTS